MTGLSPRFSLRRSIYDPIRKAGRDSGGGSHETAELTVATGRCAEIREIYDLIPEIDW